MTTITDLITALQDANGSGGDTPFSIEDEAGRTYEYVEVYLHPREDRYVIVVQASDEEG